MLLSWGSGDSDMNPSIEKILSTTEEVGVGEPWFKVLKLPNEVFAIHEPKHHEQVISFLIAGSQKAILFDTGMGIKDILKVVNLLTDREVMVVNSHTHFDHMGDDYRFPHIFVFDDERAIERLASGWPHSEIYFDADLENFAEGYPEGFEPTGYEIKPVRKDQIHRLKDGDVIDLGNRKLQVLHTPGHSQESIVLLDRENRSLFTGDTFYPDWLYAFMSGSWGESILPVYYETIQKLSKLVPELDYLYCSHVVALADPQMLPEVATALKAILDQSETNHEDVTIFGQNLTAHHFNGFSIVTKKVQ
jgi:glyoxylase-like metal-dependent hydrolase (beta-lactamase superfamily II)